MTRCIFPLIGMFSASAGRSEVGIEMCDVMLQCHSVSGHQNQPLIFSTTLQEDNRVLRRSLTHVPMSANVTKRSTKPSLQTIESVSELSNSMKVPELIYDVDTSVEHENSESFMDRRASAPAFSPRPLHSTDWMAGCDPASPPTFTGLREFRHDDSLSSLTMPSPTTMVSFVPAYANKHSVLALCF